MPTSTRTALTGFAAAVVLAAAASGCSALPTREAGGSSSTAPRAADGSSASASATPSAAPTPVTLKANVADEAKKVKVDKLVTVRADGGTVAKVELRYRGADGPGATSGTVSGRLNADRTQWQADERLEPGATYTLVAQGVGTNDKSKRTTTTFTTRKLSLSRQVSTKVYPDAGDEVGVGMPVIVTFGAPVQDKAEVERNLHVTATPQQEGTWHWYSSTEVHYRPKVYWQPGTKVSVDAAVNGVDVGGGRYGQNSATTHFTVGRSLVTKVDLKSDLATVYRDGKKVRTIKVSGGKPGWVTRSGVKLIKDKERDKVFTNEAIGAAESYRLVGKYALRVTDSGEFLHSAPWNTKNLGKRNTSHGCVGMSIEDSGWLYRNTLLGDPVVTTGTDRGLEQGNGWTDWNLSYQKYAKGSAL